MRYIILGTVLNLAIAVSAVAGTFDFVVETTVENQTFTFHTEGAANFNIDWGDGQTVSGLSGTALRSHVYAAPGIYTNKVGGTAQRVAFGLSGCTPLLLRDVVSRLSDGVSGIIYSSYMFQGAANITHFTQADWFDAASANVTFMANMFSGAVNFNQDLDGWNVGSARSMERMFAGAAAFTGDIGGWDVSDVTNMTGMFSGARAFNGDIGGWYVGNVVTMDHMFNGATAFNQPIGGWNVGKVTSMAYMFSDAKAFNQPIGGWDVGRVTTMFAMFMNATAFNQDIGVWDVGSVNNMLGMFNGATAFNQPIGGWNVGSVTTMRNMFRNAISFKQDISRWNVMNVSNFTEFLFGGSLPTEHYDLLLNRWSRQNLKLSLSFHGGLSKYSLGSPDESRSHIKDVFNWSITDGGTTGKLYAYDTSVILVK